MSLAKRQVEIAHIGCQVDGKVMAQVARNLTDTEDGFLRDMKYFVCDHDVLFTKEFRSILEDSGVEVIGAFGIASRSTFLLRSSSYGGQVGCPISASLRQTRVGCSQQNGYAERFVKSIKTECLDHYIFLGEKPLRRAVEQYVKHYHHESSRSATLVTNHQGLDNLIPFPQSTGKPDKHSTIRKSERLGGLLNYYHRNEKEVDKAA